MDTFEDHINSIINTQSSNWARDVQYILEELVSKASSANYVYRGEPQCYDEVTSTLYRQIASQKIEVSNVHLRKAEIESIKIAGQFTGGLPKGFGADGLSLHPSSDKEAFEILFQIRHFGGDTNLIDFTTDYHVALFFACSSDPHKNGRVVLLSDPRPSGGWLQPTRPANRIIAQKSGFIWPQAGHFCPEVVVEVPYELKKPLLSYLVKGHGINPRYIYGDLHGYIDYLKLHNNPYVSFIAGLACYEKECLPEAIRHYTNTIEVVPDSINSLINRGIAYLDACLFCLAIDDFNFVEDMLNSSSFGSDANRRGIVFYCRGIAWICLKKWKLAKADLDFAADNCHLDIRSEFEETYGSIVEFQKKFSLTLPKEIVSRLS